MTTQPDNICIAIRSTTSNIHEAIDLMREIYAAYIRVLDATRTIPDTHDYYIIYPADYEYRLAVCVPCAPVDWLARVVYAYEPHVTLMPHAHEMPADYAAGRSWKDIYMEARP